MSRTARASDASLPSSVSSSAASSLKSRTSIVSTNTEYSQCSAPPTASSSIPDATSRGYAARPWPGSGAKAPSGLESVPEGTSTEPDSSAATEPKAKGKGKVKAKPPSDQRLCLYCPQTAKQNSDHKKHFLRTCPSLGRGTEVLRCTLCGHLGRVWRQMRTHCKDYHSEGLAKWKHLPESEENWPTKYFYTLETLPAKKQFTCLCEGGIVYTDVSKLFKHFDKFKCARVGYSEAAHCNRFQALMLQVHRTDGPNGHHTSLFAEALVYANDEEHLRDILKLVRGVSIDKVKEIVDRLEWGTVNLGALNGRGYSDIPSMAKEIVALLLDMKVEELTPFPRRPSLEPTEGVPADFWLPEDPVPEQPLPECDMSLAQFNFGFDDPAVQPCLAQGAADDWHAQDNFAPGQFDSPNGDDLVVQPCPVQGAADHWYAQDNFTPGQFASPNGQHHTDLNVGSHSLGATEYDPGEVNHLTGQPNTNLGETSEFVGLTHLGPSGLSNVDGQPGINLSDSNDSLPQFDLDLSDQIMESIDDSDFDSWLNHEGAFDSNGDSTHKANIDQSPHNGAFNSEASSAVALPNRSLPLRAPMSLPHNEDLQPSTSAPLLGIPSQLSKKKGRPLSHDSQVHPESSHRSMTGPAKASGAETTSSAHLEEMPAITEAGRVRLPHDNISTVDPESGNARQPSRIVRWKRQGGFSDLPPCSEE